MSICTRLLKIAFICAYVLFFRNKKKMFLKIAQNIKLYKGVTEKYIFYKN